MDRRTLLRSAGLAAALLAGCVGSDEPGAGTSPATPTDAPGDGGTPTGTGHVAGTTFEVVENECGTERNEATVSFGGDAVTVDGTIGGSNTCYTAELRDASVDGGELTVAVQSFVPEDRQTRACGQCLVDIEYDARVEFDGGIPDRVVVTHDGEVVARRER